MILKFENVTVLGQSIECCLKIINTQGHFGPNLIKKEFGRKTAIIKIFLSSKGSCSFSSRLDDVIRLIFYQVSLEIL